LQIAGSSELLDPAARQSAFNPESQRIPQRLDNRYLQFLAALPRVYEQLACQLQNRIEVEDLQEGQNPSSLDYFSPSRYVERIAS
jgi:phage gp36-like protein